MGLTDLFIPFHQLRWEKQFRKGYYAEFSHYCWKIENGELERLDFELFIKEQVEKIVSAHKPSFEAFVRDFREVLQALVDQPVTAGSGIYENVPGIQRTYQDMQNEIASKLVKLDQYTARVKIASDGKSVEHTIQMLNPKKESRLSDAALRQRIADIQAQNINDGYVRERIQVEDEIRRRQDQCSEPPGSPTLLEPSPEPPGAPRRKKIT